MTSDCTPLSQPLRPPGVLLNRNKPLWPSRVAAIPVRAPPHARVCLQDAARPRAVEKSEAQRLQNAMLARSKYDASMSIRENNLQGIQRP